jgi:hypothetical protein
MGNTYRKYARTWMNQGERNKGDQREMIVLSSTATPDYLIILRSVRDDTHRAADILKKYMRIRGYALLHDNVSYTAYY